MLPINLRRVLPHAGSVFPRVGSGNCVSWRVGSHCHPRNPVPVHHHLRQCRPPHPHCGHPRWVRPPTSASAPSQSRFHMLSLSSIRRERRNMLTAITAMGCSGPELSRISHLSLALEPTANVKHDPCNLAVSWPLLTRAGIY